jgi:hypothetical protein
MTHPHEGLQEPALREALEKEEFCRRFKARMLERCHPRTHFDDGESIAEYADDTAPTYWEDHGGPLCETPEECADADMSYWGE